MIILNALNPNIATLHIAIQKHLGINNIYDSSYDATTGNIEIYDYDRDFTCKISIKRDFNEIEITNNIPDPFKDEVIDGIIIPSFVDIDVQKISEEIKKVLKGNDNERYIPTVFKYLNNEYFLMTTLEKDHKSFEFKIVITKIDDSFKLHVIPMYSSYSIEEVKYIREYINGVENFINIIKVL